MTVGDYIGGIYQHEDGTWYIKQGKINKVTETKKYGVRYFTDEFYPIKAEEVKENTNILLGGDFVFVEEVFELNEQILTRLERFVKNANEHPERVNWW